MINAKDTFNVYLDEFVKANLPEFVKLYKGNENNPRVNPPSLTIEWLTGEEKSDLIPEFRCAMAQLELRMPDSDDKALDRAAIKILEALRQRTGSNPIFTLPKREFSNGRPGTLLGSNMIIGTLLGSGWKTQSSDEQDTKIQILTVVVDYLPG